MNDQRNLVLAIVLSVLILVGFQLLWPAQPRAPQAVPQTAAAPQQPIEAPALAAPPSAQSAAPHTAPAVDRADVIQTGGRIPVKTPKTHGSIALLGGRIDDLVLSNYRETVDPKSPEIALLSPAGSHQAYYAQFGWVSSDPAIKLPDGSSVWNAVKAGDELTPDHSVSMTWDNGNGLRFVRTIAVDADYMFSIADRVENYGNQPAALVPYAFINRTGTPVTAGTYILHEGPLGVLDGSLKEVKYDELRKERQIVQKGSGGWIGITDKYWLTALVPDQGSANSARFSHLAGMGADRYQVDFTGSDALTIAPGASAQTGYHLFAGAKNVQLLDADSQKYGIDKFDLAIDFGWFWFLTKPFFYLLRMFHDLFGGMGAAILAMTVLVKLAMFPLANKSYVAMNKMKLLQPELKKLQERFPEDKMRLQQEMMALYKREKVNPASGCLPMVIQIPVFFALYKVLYVTIEMRHAPFIGWIHDLSAPDPTTLFNLFGLIPWTPPEMLAHLGVWPLIMGVTMWLQQKLNPQPTDPMQAKMMQYLPVMFTFMLGQFAAGLVIYWTWSNILSILQQWVITRRAGVRS